MSSDSNLIAESSEKVVSIVGDVTSDDIDTYAKYRDIEDKSKLINTILSAWNNQKKDERRLRKTYAVGLLWILAIQLIFINIVFILIGSETLKIEHWMGNIFIVSVFGEITATVLIVTKYLFPSEKYDIVHLLRNILK